MNSLLLAVLMSCSPGATYPDAPYPDAEPANGGSSSHQGRPRLCRWLRSHHHDNKCPSAGNSHAGGRWLPVAPAVEAGTVETVTLESAPTVVPPPACHCAGNGHAGGNWLPVAAAPAPIVLPPAPRSAPAGPAPRLVPVPQPQPVTTGAEPPIAE